MVSAVAAPFGWSACPQVPSNCCSVERARLVSAAWFYFLDLKSMSFNEQMRLKNL